MPPSLTPPTASAEADPIGPKPTLGAPKSFDPPVPTVFQTANGITVWLVERPELPIVSASFVIPYGSASDPEDAPGTMALLADMVDEGAGSRDALQLSETISSLGASLSVGAGLDATTASVMSLRSKFDTTFEILCDLMARAKLSNKDFQRTHKLWTNYLKKRSDDPTAVASITASSILFGAKAPYGHPSAGLHSKAATVTLAKVKDAYAKTWRPERATLVVTGQITKAELEAALQKNLASWKGVGEALPVAKPTRVLDKLPRFVLVDRPKAVQTVIYAARAGTSASDERQPSLSLVNDALGGSFTSRLNLNLRENKGWTYGVASWFQSTKGEGSFVIRTSVDAEHTGESLQEILTELTNLSRSGLSDGELGKVKAQDRASLVEMYEGVTGTGGRLTSLASLGLPYAFDAGASRIRQGASLDDLARLARAHFDPNSFTFVFVGDRATVEKQLADRNFEMPKLYTNEGAPIPRG